IEDKDLYLANLKVYRDSLMYKTEVDKYLKELTHILNNLKRHIYTRELLELDIAYCAYKAGDRDFRDYLEFLIRKAKEKGIKVKNSANLYLLVQAMELENRIEFEKANRERNILIDELKRRLSKNEVRELAEKSVGFSVKRIKMKAFYGYLLDKAGDLGLDADRFSALADYMVYVSIYETVDRHEVMEELDELEKVIKEPLFRNDAQRRLDGLSRRLALLSNIFAIQLTKRDYRYYLENKSSFEARNFVDFIGREAPKYGITARPGENTARLDDFREDIAKFYEYSFKRDDVFLKNLRFNRGKGGIESAMLMTGGFHTENLCELFEKQNISYVSILPKFTSEKGYECPYFNLLAGQVIEVERLLSSALAQAGVMAIASRLNPVLHEYVEGARSRVIFELHVRWVEAVKRGLGGLRIDANNRDIVVVDKEGQDLLGQIRDIPEKELETFETADLEEVVSTLGLERHIRVIPPTASAETVVDTATPPEAEAPAAEIGGVSGISPAGRFFRAAGSLGRVFFFAAVLTFFAFISPLLPAFGAGYQPGSLYQTVKVVKEPLRPAYSRAEERGVVNVSDLTISPDLLYDLAEELQECGDFIGTATNYERQMQVWESIKISNSPEYQNLVKEAYDKTINAGIVDENEGIYPILFLKGLTRPGFALALNKLGIIVVGLGELQNMEKQDMGSRTAWLAIKFTHELKHLVNYRTRPGISSIEDEADAFEVTWRSVKEFEGKDVGQLLAQEMVYKAFRYVADNPGIFCEALGTDDIRDLYYSDIKISDDFRDVGITLYNLRDDSVEPQMFWVRIMEDENEFEKRGFKKLGAFTLSLPVVDYALHADPAVAAVLARITGAPGLSAPGEYVASATAKTALVGGALKDIDVSAGDEDAERIQEDIIEKWRDKAGLAEVKEENIKGLTIKAKFITDKDIPMPPAMSAYHLYDNEGNLVIVTREGLKEENEAVWQEAVFHEDRESEGIKSMSREFIETQPEWIEGTAIPADEMSYIWRKAHILAAADEILAFGEEGITPYHLSQIAKMTELNELDKIRRLLAENRRGHHELIEESFGADNGTGARAKIERYEERFRIELRESLLVSEMSGYFDFLRNCASRNVYDPAVNSRGNLHSMNAWFATNETDWDLSLEEIRGKTGVYMGTGFSGVNLSRLCRGDFDLAVIVDRNPFVTEVFMPIRAALIMMSRNRAEYLALLSGIELSATELGLLENAEVESIETAIREKAGDILSGLKNGSIGEDPRIRTRETIWSYLGKNLPEEILPQARAFWDRYSTRSFGRARMVEAMGGGRDSWLADEKNFLKIKRMTEDGKIRGVTGDWLAEEPKTGIGEELLKRDLSLSVVYLSNLMEKSGAELKKFTGNYPYAKDGVLLITNELGDTVYEYIQPEEEVKPAPAEDLLGTLAGLPSMKEIISRMDGVRLDILLETYEKIKSERSLRSQTVWIKIVSHFARELFGNIRPGDHTSVLLVPFYGTELDMASQQKLLTEPKFGIQRALRDYARVHVVHYMADLKGDALKKQIEEKVKEIMRLDGFIAAKGKKDDPLARVIAFAEGDEKNKEARDHIARVLSGSGLPRDKITGVISGAFRSEVETERFSLGFLTEFGVGLMERDRVKGQKEMLAKIDKAL
ncbi:MAG: hypothetical protein ABIA77_07170, partial [Candidatus Omnitrophota bacterium]